MADSKYNPKDPQAFIMKWNGGEVPTSGLVVFDKEGGKDTDKALAEALEALGWLEDVTE